MSLGKILIFIGAFLMLIGLALNYFTKLPFLGRLPGDFKYESEGTQIYIPITSSIVISIILSIVLYLIAQLRK